LNKQACLQGFSTTLNLESDVIFGIGKIRTEPHRTGETHQQETEPKLRNRASF